MLSPESSAEPGRWNTDRAPYQRGMMDAFSDPLIESIVLMTSAQIGKTEILNNAVGFYIDQDPAPILVMQPNERPMGYAWSTDRLTPMLRDTPCLQGKVAEPKSRTSGNTILHKIFHGGHITVVGANSPAGLASRPIRIVLCDEIDRYPESAGTEGDPIALAFRRADTFWNRKKLLTSTPTIKGLSRIEAAFEESDQRHFYVPCPHCQVMQTLKWEHMRYETDESKTKCTAVWYACASCGALIEEAHKQAMLKGGQWRATKPGRRIAGFALNAIYSPWKRWEEMVNEWLDAQKDVTLLQVFVNTLLGEPWEERAGPLSPESMLQRREPYPVKPGTEQQPVPIILVPQGVALMTAGVDVQEDRLEVIVRGWGALEQSWLIRRELLLGDPMKLDVWQQLDQFLMREWPLASGKAMRVDTACVDSGYATDEVYAFCQPRYARRVFAVKGYSQPGRPLVGKKPTVNNKRRCRVFMVGVDTAKDTVYKRLKIAEPGPGYMHFPLGQDTIAEDYFKQLTAETAVRQQVRGRWVRRYMLKRGERNEALDCEVYALAALALSRVPRDQLEQYAQAVNPVGATPVPAGEPPREPEPDSTPTRERLRQMLQRPYPKGWMGGLR